MELAIVVCVVLGFVVLLQIRHWHGRAVASLRAEEHRRAQAARARIRAEDAEEPEPRWEDRTERRRRAA